MATGELYTYYPGKNVLIHIFDKKTLKYVEKL